VNEPPRKPGRPPLDPAHPSVPVCFKVPARQYDDLLRRAQQERTSVGAVIRRSLQRDDDDD
jgi:hypothetical protein